ncbi:MAG: hypothetical protein DRO73_00855 [Candidatus Thorarchaeota archaeon]|nr:MAG: hypothetical protein DRO73_00855 [Candidatus Thorarchaeota archaeon]RLI53736.1 MAG: hypothetical protein DRO93_13355 [Candidatus Thorarchaeota archaeon]
MGIRRFLEPAISRFQADERENKFNSISLVIVISFVLVVAESSLALGLGQWNPFHVVYLLLGLSFLPVVISCSSVMQTSKNDLLTREQHQALRNSSIRLGFLWNVLLYLGVIAIGLNDLRQIQQGVEVPVSHYQPDLLMGLLIGALCISLIFLTIAASFWQWDCFKIVEGTQELTLDEDTYRKRTSVVLLVLSLVFVLLLVFKSVLEQEFAILRWMSSLPFGITLLLTVILLGVLFHKNRGTLRPLRQIQL